MSPTNLPFFSPHPPKISIYAKKKSEKITWNSTLYLFTVFEKALSIALLHYK